ncbi:MULTISPECIES: hypothetical protein [Burkholderia]|nr:MULTISPECIES: hypothetical protein [Burkholderia]EKS9800288.1 hypothetical protein [Burkholderia cepacia]EKS9807889.1 hypothetical protein [Burkholderia cepacia]EKS9815489.1 hypothetical protein [Burkholderia cepacia]EKS9823002.1 hypothetical protein [Burkholderia cepacia]EKS9830592.1 hypothetical protein [Burkholderia cepacia]
MSDTTDKSADALTVPTISRDAFYDIVRAAMKKYRDENPSRYLNDDQVDANDGEFVSALADQHAKLITGRPVEQHEAAPADDARECLMDVVSHHGDFEKACRALKDAASDDGNGSDASYWLHQIDVLGRMKAQAERALAAPSAPLEGTGNGAEVSGAYTYSSVQATNCACCGEYKHTPLRIDWMGGYVCLTCIDRELESRIPADVADLNERAMLAAGQWATSDTPIKEALAYRDGFVAGARAPRTEVAGAEGVLRAALDRLENACDKRAELLTRDAYLAAEAIPGMRDALYELDEARRQACDALSRAPRTEVAGACKHCGATTAQTCNDRGCFYLESGDGEPSADAAAEDKYVIERLSTVLAGVAAALLGEEADRPAAETLQKLPEEAAKLRLELDLYRAQAADAAAAPADERASFEAWWYEREAFGLRAERLDTPEAAARAAWNERAAASQPAAAARPSDDELWDQTLRERDEYQETADKLAAAIAKHFGVGIGEHSNLNCPWDEALEVIENAAPPAQVATRQEMTDAARDVLAERRRQVEQEGWTAEHDDEHCSGDLELAAACYAIHASERGQHNEFMWPWPSEWWKPTTKRRNLIKAGALIQAAIERLDRALLEGDKS